MKNWCVPTLPRIQNAYNGEFRSGNDICQYRIDLQVILYIILIIVLSKCFIQQNNHPKFVQEVYMEAVDVMLSEVNISLLSLDRVHINQIRKLRALGKDILHICVLCFWFALPLISAPWSNRSVVRDIQTYWHVCRDGLSLNF